MVTQAQKLSDVDSSKQIFLNSNNHPFHNSNQLQVPESVILNPSRVDILKKLNEMQSKPRIDPIERWKIDVSPRVKPEGAMPLAFPKPPNVAQPEKPRPWNPAGQQIDLEVANTQSALFSTLVLREDEQIPA